jgi:hypothetical protein|tara:strand:- start:437 stop:544 length:108 start_codon:yes stop_codon:yes gene_type:complete
MRDQEILGQQRRIELEAREEKLNQKRMMDMERQRE